MLHRSFLLFALALALSFPALYADDNSGDGGGADAAGVHSYDVTITLPPNDSDPVAIINGLPITKADFVQRLVEWHGVNVLEEMVTRSLVDQEIKRLGVANTPEEVDKRIDLQVNLAEEEFKQQSGGQMKFDDYLKSKGESIKTFRDMLFHNENFQKQIALEKMVQYAIMTEEQVEVQHIVVENELKAREIHELLHKGADFAKLAQEKSQDQLSGSQGGKMVPFIRGLSPMGITFDEVAYKLKDGEMSDVVQTQRGFHVIRKIVSRPGNNKTYSEMKEEVWKQLVASPVNKRATMAWLYRLKYDSRDKIKIELKHK